MSTIETNVVKPEVRFFENDTENLVIDPFNEALLDGKVSSIESYIDNNSGKGKTDEEKDEDEGEG